MSESRYPASERSRVRRHPERGSHERAVVDAILDEGLVCHLGLSTREGPVVLPMAYGRQGERLILHGAPVSRALLALAGGVPACLTVTLLDGLVIARSAYHSSLNYRSVVAFGRARLIEGEAEKRAALDALVEHLLPGRVTEARPTTVNEVAGTSVVAFEIEHASAKVRSGPPIEPAEDASFPTWAGVVPLRLAAGTPEPAPNLPPGIDPTPSVREQSRRGRPATNSA